MKYGNRVYHESKRRYWFLEGIGNKLMLKRIRNLLENIQESPFEGIGKQEQLKYDWIGYWSRRITQEHRLIYEVLNNKILIYSLKRHYE